MKLWGLDIVRYARKERRALLGIVLTMGLAIALDVLKPWPMKLIVDHVFGGQAWPAALLSFLPSLANASPRAVLAFLAASTVLLMLAAQAVRFVQSYVQTGAGSRMAFELGADIFHHLQRLSVRFHRRRQSGDLIRRVTSDSSCVNQLILDVILPAATSLISLATMFAVMWRLDHALSLLALTVVPILGAIIAFFARPMTDRSYRQQQLEGEMMALAEQALTALPVIQAFTREKIEDERFRSLSRHTVHAYLRSVIAQLQFKVSTGTVTALGTAAIMAVGGLHALHGQLSVGGLLVLLAYLGALYAPMETLAYLSSGYASAAASARRVLEILEADDVPREMAGATSLPVQPPGQRGHVRIEGVTFGYDPERPVLVDVSLEARPGETVAIVGPTGAGKTTLVSLIPRFFDPSAGRITLEGRDTKEITVASLRSRISLVLQEPFLLPLTIRENIAYGRPEASDDDIIAAARVANADEFIRRLPHGYDTTIGERGVTLSGGEKQRLSIARAILKDADVLILDEPTSALDTVTESALLEALERLRAGKTTLVIAHRLSTVQRADRIVVLEHGRVVETGTHDELLRAGGRYLHYHNLFFNRPAGDA